VTIYDEAADAFNRGDLGQVRVLLSPLVASGDMAAQTALGTFLSLDAGCDPLVYAEGMELLRRAAHAGYGHAAHNLATALVVGSPASPPNHEEARRYMQIAYDSGFEATVSSDPLWWKTAARDEGATRSNSQRA